MARKPAPPVRPSPRTNGRAAPTNRINVKHDAQGTAALALNRLKSLGVNVKPVDKPARNGGSTGGVVPQIITFAGYSGQLGRVYRNPDNAWRDSQENSEAMRNDLSIMECVDARTLMTALMPYHLETDGDKSSTAKELVNTMQAIIKQTPDFTEYRRCLQEATWYGRFANQHNYRTIKLRGRNVTAIAGDDRWPAWSPINGDKLAFPYNRQGLGIRIGWAMDQKELKWYGDQGSDGKDKEFFWDGERCRKVEITSEYGRVYFLDHDELDRICLHKHFCEDAPFSKPLQSGRVHGVGIRDRIYWTWFLKANTCALLTEYLERSAFGFEIWTYPLGNDQALQAIQTAAETRTGFGKNIVFVPVQPGQEGLMTFEHQEIGMQGAELYNTLIHQYYEWQIKRYILGQILSSEPEGGGLGSSGISDLQGKSLRQIIQYDSQSAEESLTRGLVEPLRRRNKHILPVNSDDIPLFFKIDTRADESEKLIEGIERLHDMGLPIKMDTLYDIAGIEKPAPEDELLPAKGGGVMAPGFGPGMGGQGEEQRGEAPDAAGDEQQPSEGEKSRPDAPPLDNATGETRTPGTPRPERKLPEPSRNRKSQAEIDRYTKGLAQRLREYYPDLSLFKSRQYAKSLAAVTFGLPRPKSVPRDKLSKLVRDINQWQVERHPASLALAKANATDVDRYAAKQSHDFSSTQLNLPPELAKQVVALGKLIKDHDLADDGREAKPHITVKFGLHTDDPAEVEAAVHLQSPIAVTLGSAGAFEGDSYDVVKIEVKSEALVKLHDRIGEACECTDTHPDYQPHVTIAYVKPGLGKKYAGMLNALKGRVAVFDTMVFSDKQREHHTLQLSGTAKFAKPLSMAEKEKYSAQIANILRTKYKESAAGKKAGWITIGAKGSPAHGGSPVKVGQGGKIVAGAANLKGRNLGNIKEPPKAKAKPEKKPREEKPEADTQGKGHLSTTGKRQAGSRPDYNKVFSDAISEASERYDVAPDQLKEAVKEEWKHRLEQHEGREKIKAELRIALNKGGISSAQIAKMHARGDDYANLPDWDNLSRDIVSEAGGSQYGFDVDNAPEEMWNLIGEGRRIPTPKHDPDLIKSVAKRLEREKDLQPAGAGSHAPSAADRAAGYDDSIGFSRKGPKTRNRKPLTRRTKRRK